FRRVLFRSNSLGVASKALHAWACALRDLGSPLPLWRRLLAPLRQWRAQITQRAGPGVKRLAGNSAAILSTSSSLEPGANVRSKEPLYSSHCQLFSLDKLSLLAALSESPNPAKIISDCP